MIRLFLKLFLLMVLTLWVSKWVFESLYARQSYLDRQRVITGVHLGGMRLIANQLLTAPEDRRDAMLGKIQLQFRAPLELRPLNELSPSQRTQLGDSDGFIYSLKEYYREHLSIPLDDDEYLRLGPFTDYTVIAFEDSLWGWLQLLSFRINATSKSQDNLDSLSKEFGLPIEVHRRDELPKLALDRFSSGRDVAFFRDQGKYFASTKLQGEDDYVCVGPLPEFQDVSASASRATLTSAFVTSGLLIGLIIFSLSRKFRDLENTARSIAGGDLKARADERNAGEIGELAKALNLMATKTESMIQSKQELLQMVSHELRTPLSRLKFALDLMEMKSDNPKQDRRVQIIHQSMDDLESIVSEIIDYVKNDDQALNQSLEWIDVHEIIQSVSQLISLETPNLKLEFAQGFDQESPMLFADRFAFARVVKNLLGNAQRYAKSKLIVRAYQVSNASVSETIASRSTLKGEAGGTHLCIEFEDDGPGIPENKWVEVVEPFVRISDDSSTNFRSPSTTELSSPPPRRNHTGIGLGLAIVKRLLSQHSGRLEISRGKVGGCLIRTYWPNPAGDS